MSVGASRGGARPVEIVGGGLAGLSLGLALRRAGVPVTVYEAQDYPRHRVCGEFIAGLDAATIACLGLTNALGGARQHRRVAWFRRGRPVRAQTLPVPALGLSRHTLDARLAEAFAAAGGDLRVGRRLALDELPEGRLLAAGRRRRPSPWFGLKVHVRRVRVESDLEVHLGDHAYVGLSGVEDGAVNVCGLFRRGPAERITPARGGPAWLLRCLEHAGLDRLATRLRGAEIEPESFCAVAGFGFDSEAPPADHIRLGDALAMTPPFTGNGMAMAFQSAADAVDPLRDWAEGRRTWQATIATVNRRLWRRFHRRLFAANLLHPFLLETGRQRWLEFANRARLLPLQPLYRVTH